MIVDSHCHLDFSNLFNQLDDVVKRAKNKNVETLLTICTTLDSFEKIKLIIALLLPKFIIKKIKNY